MAITFPTSGDSPPLDCDGPQLVVQPKLGAGRCFRALDGVLPRTVVREAWQKTEDNDRPLPENCGEPIAVEHGIQGVSPFSTTIMVDSRIPPCYDKTVAFVKEC